MNPTIMKARITDQRLQLVNETLIASGGVNEVQIQFEFCRMWEGGGKVAVFYRDPAAVYHELIVDGLVTVPHEVLAEEGFFYFGVMGTADNIRTTQVVRVHVAKGAITVPTMESLEPTPNIYEQILASYGRMETELDLQRKRINEFAIVRATGGTMTWDVVHNPEDGPHYGGYIKSNGAIVWVDILVSLLTLEPYGEYYLTDLPDAFVPLMTSTISTETGYRTIAYRDSYSTELEGPVNCIGIRNTTGETLSRPQFAVQGFVYLDTVFVPELADIRVRADGTVYETAGEAVRALDIKDDTRISAENTWSIKNTLDKMCRPIEQSAGVVACYPVEGYPLAVKADYSAPNLLSVGDISDKNGVTVTDNGDGSYTLNGTATANTSWLFFPTDYESWTVGEGLRLTGCPAGGSLAYRLMAEGPDGDYHYDLGEGAAFTVSEGMVASGLSVYIALAGNMECDNLTFRPRLIKEADAPAVITRTGKNLWDFKNAVQRYTVTTNKDGDRIEYWGHRLVLPPGKYTLHADRVSGTTARYIYGDINGADGAHKGDVNIVAGSVINTKTITITEGDVLYIYNGNTSSTENGSNNIFKEYNVQIEVGTAATAYEPYTAKEFALDWYGAATVPAADGANCLKADKGTITVTGAENPQYTLARLEAALTSMAGGMMNE